MTELLAQSSQNVLVKRPPEEIRAAIVRFENLLSELDGAVFNDAFPLKHSFADGCYIREMTIPKGCVGVGKIHKHSHPRFVLCGEFIAFTEHDGWKYCKAPAYVTSQAGRKSILIALEDCVVVTVHVTDETDLKKIEEDVIAVSYDAFEAYKEIAAASLNKTGILGERVK